MANIMYKVYGAFYPVEKELFTNILNIGNEAMPAQDEAWLFFEKDMLRFSFEGLYFPQDDILLALESRLSAESSGKLDILDMEQWKLYRHVWKNGNFEKIERNLNDILEPAANFK